jgi:hypothetical protein
MGLCLNSSYKSDRINCVEIMYINGGTELLSRKLQSSHVMKTDPDMHSNKHVLNNTMVMFSAVVML